MTCFRKLPGFAPSPAGLERAVLRMLPRVLLCGTLLFAMPPVVVRGLVGLGVMAETGSLMMLDIYCISLIVLHWTVVFTAGIAAFIVFVMKGPAYVADAYPLQDSDKPK